MDAKTYLYLGLTSSELSVCACLLRTFGPEKGKNPFWANAALRSRLTIKAAVFALQILFKPYDSNFCSKLIIMPSFAHVILPDCFISLINVFGVTGHTYMVWTNAEGGVEFQISFHTGVMAQAPSSSLHGSRRASWYLALLQSVNEWNAFKSSCLLFLHILCCFQRTCFSIWLVIMNSPPDTSPHHQ